MLQLHSHKPPILHRDLKSPNLLVDKHWRVKIADFNLSRVMEAQSIVSSLSTNNPRWLAPEVVTYLCTDMPLLTCAASKQHAFAGLGAELQ